MNLALVPTFPNRPAWVKKDGWHVCVSVHDAYFWQKRAWFRARLPQRRAAYQQWRWAELWWYHEHGLTAPTGEQFRVDGKWARRKAA